MSKINVDVLLRENGVIKINETYSGILRDNIIKYSDGIINIYDLESNILKRKTDEYVILLNFANSTALYTYNNLKMSLNLGVEKLYSQNEKVVIKYKLEENTFEYKISWRKV